MKNSVIKIGLKGTKKYIFLLLILSMGFSYLSLQTAIYIKYAIDNVICNNYETLPIFLKSILTSNYIYDLLIISAIIVVINFILMIVSYLRNIITSKLKLKINTNVKLELYKHTLNLEYKSYNSCDKTEILQRITEDADVYSNFFQNQFNMIIDIIFLSIFIITETVNLNSAITIYFVLTFIVMTVFFLWYLKKLDKQVGECIGKRKKLLGVAMLNLNNFKLIRMLNKQKDEIEKYKTLNKECTNSNIKLIKLILFYEIMSDHITYLKTPVIFIIGGISVITGNMSIGGITVLLNYAEKLFSYFLELGANFESIDNFYVVSKKIKKLLELKEETKNKNTYDLNGDIIFSNVNIFADSKVMLKDLNFLIKKGEKIAIIGDNGSGKSLLSKAILGFNDYNGNIYINNHNVNRLNKSNIREYVDLVEGDSYIFKGTILENVLLNNKEKGKLLEEVFRDCELYEDIQRFNEKENTLVGEKGTKLSGGQKQRISIARTLIKNKPILIFDEALNKIDKATKEKILMNLMKKYSNKTMIFITHDLSIIEYVDRIIYIDNRTTIIGEHIELMNRSSKYEKLVNKNFNIGAKDEFKK